MKEKKNHTVFPKLQSVFSGLKKKEKKMVNSYNMSVSESNSHTQFHPFADIKYGQISSYSSCLD